MEVFRTLVADHARMRALFNDFAFSSRRDVASRARLCLHLRAELEQHARGEEAHLYPALRRHAETRGFVDDAGLSHAQLKEALARLDASIPDSRLFRERLAHLEWLVVRHFRTEETEVFPAAERTFSPAEATAIGEKITAMRPDPHEPEPAPRTDR
jgi:hypothetical protein